MKILYQWAKRNPTDWEQCDATEWASLPKLPVPQQAQLGGQSNALGWIRNVSVQGLTVEGYDHIAIEPIIIGLDEGVKLTVWNNDPDDAVVEGVENWINEPQAIVWTILPLAPDPKLGMAINTRQSCVRYAQGERYTRLLVNPPANVTVRPWSDFIEPAVNTVRHGVWLTNEKFNEHVVMAPQAKWGWMHWNEHLPESECEIAPDGRRVLKQQRAQGRYKQAERTITYYQRDTARAAGAFSATNENALELSTAGAGTQTITMNATTIDAWSFTAPANEPNSADWPSGTFHAQFNCTASSAGTTLGAHPSVGAGYNRLNSALTSSLDGVSPAANHSGTGFFLSNSGTWDSAAGSATDVYAICTQVTGDSHGDLMTLQFNTTDSYADGPWSSSSAALTGTITSSATEADIVAGGKTIILTLTGDTFVASGATFDAQRQNIINGIDSAQSEGTGWDAVVKAGLAVTDVVRTSATVVTITLPAFATFNITATETITATIPATALTGAVQIIATPTFTITAVSTNNSSFLNLF